ncbi:MAG: hypothetical protein QOD44_332 [Solirubrobacteraceae bacterium]|jgi:hypothetical protein|nr:hypothetical protein [Solirubrobacteraceae bacterium]
MARENDERRLGGRARRAVTSGEVERARQALRTAGASAARSQPSSTTETDVDGMRAEVERRMARGDRFSDVEEAIHASALSADEKSALWLLGWSYVNWRAQRREARAHLATLAPHQPAPPARRRRMLRVVS